MLLLMSCKKGNLWDVFALIVICKEVKILLLGVQLKSVLNKLFLVSTTRLLALGTLHGKGKCSEDM